MPCLHWPRGVQCCLWQKLDFVSVLLGLQGGLPTLMGHHVSDSSLDACLSMARDGLPPGCGTDPALVNPLCTAPADRLQHRRLVPGRPPAPQGALAVAVVHLISDGTADVSAADDHAACRASIPSQQPGKVRPCWKPATSRSCTGLMSRGVSLTGLCLAALQTLWTAQGVLQTEQQCSMHAVITTL